MIKDYINEDSVFKISLALLIVALFFNLKNSFTFPQVLIFSFLVFTLLIVIPKMVDGVIQHDNDNIIIKVKDKTPLVKNNKTHSGGKGKNA